MNKILITGGLGFIGINLIGYLRAKHPNIEINLVERNTSSKLDFPNINIMYKSLLEISNSDIDLKSVDAIFLLAGSSGPDVSSNSNNNPDLEANKNIIKLAISQNSTARIIFPSTQLVYAGSDKPYTETNTDLQPINAYVKSKLECENSIKQLVKDGLLTYTIARISNPFGLHIPRKQNYNYANQLLFQLLKGETITLFNADERKNFIPILNLVKILTQIIEKSHFTNEIINVGHFETTSLKEFYQKSNNIFGTGSILTIDNSNPLSQKTLVTDKLYSKFNTSELIDLNQALLQFKDFYMKVEKIELESIVNFYRTIQI